MCDIYISTPGNTTMLRDIYSSIQTAQSSPTLAVPGWERTYNALVSIPLNQHTNPLCQSGIMVEIEWDLQEHFRLN